MLSTQTRNAPEFALARWVNWRRWPAQLRAIFTICILATAYLALESMSSIHQFKGLPFSAWDPALGLLFVALLRNPAIGAIALFLGGAAAELLFASGPLHLLQSLIIAAITAIVYPLVAVVLNRWTEFDPALPGIRDTLRLLTAGLAGAVLSGVLLALFFLSSGNIALSDVSTASFFHIVGDAIGIAVMTPLLLRLLALRSSLARANFRSLAADALVFSTVALLYVWLSGGVPQAESHRYFYLLFIPAVFTAVRHGLTGAACVLATMQFALVIFLNQLAFDAANFAAHQSMMLALTATGLLVGAIISERNFIEAEARTARLRVEALTEASARAARFNLVNGMASALAHELSQPLTAARARARIIEHLSSGDDLPAVRQQLTMLLAQIDAAASILQRMRGFLAKSEAHRQEVRWSEITEKTRDLMSVSAQRHNVRLIFSNPPGEIVLVCDPVQIEQVLANLISNAIDSIASAGETGSRNMGIVEIRSELGNSGELLVAVRDDGPGIAPEMAERIFDPLVTTRTNGLGLGLAISATIVESHQGRLWLETSTPGHTEFRFRLAAHEGKNGRT
jgi:two-component system, LuxR family, sensor kinase FixL